MIDQEYSIYDQTNKIFSIKKSRSKKLKKNKNKNINSSKWTLEQNTAFFEFIKQNMELLSCPHRRKQEKVFLKLSKIVKTRTPDQCRSHHQKMIKHHQDLTGILKNLQKRLFNSIQQENSNQVNSQPDTQKQQINQCNKQEQKQKQSFNFQMSTQIEFFTQQNVSNVIAQEDLIWESINCDVWIN